MSDSTNIALVQTPVEDSGGEDFDEDLEYIHPKTGRRAISHKGQRPSRQQRDSCMVQEDEPYSDIKMEELWLLPDQPKGIRFSRPFIHTMRSKDLRILSRKAMVMIEEEAKLFRTLNQFTEMLQGDDPATHDLHMLDSLPEELGLGLQEDAEDMLGCVTETIARLQDSRKFLIKTTIQKKDLLKRLKLL
ncbi:hypothetical protein BASA50_005891 [Batrachochytrium salamandrivorans]|uniref:Transcriptional regulatory protein RXT2 N-terminal domain-containing protein n=1 Tax=Batrachochytrium salamandrivorans TaxID=1357716 RepID=A0ABQ8F2K4_9FUNG|nr:hypothetical protein BASA62_000056 [Batrachochytrium salamandrivorans]KAH6572538.1 hypothetical protein BASA62_003367 [Batrachochytrium salamandrivorans]KAH6573064.1 hypothetical protein BASA60_006232 [Batrachochytrium salamandrivorans]KAH6578424.1 hypothetical protein BASA61_000181 [Batrachochytrium salamandrivorans]KAH6578796.1 hypothetical protein BASA61_000025 [Batrachochytrium salamandrivorans]